MFHQHCSHYIARKEKKNWMWIGLCLALTHTKIFSSEFILLFLFFFFLFLFLFCFLLFLGNFYSPVYCYIAKREGKKKKTNNQGIKLCTRGREGERTSNRCDLNSEKYARNRNEESPTNCLAKLVNLEWLFLFFPNVVALLYGTITDERLRNRCDYCQAIWSNILTTA